MDVWLYNFLLLFHVLFFVYWLGADLGVFYGARFAADRRLSPETRTTVGDIMAFVDLFPRVSVPLIGAVGASLAVMSGGFRFSPIWLLPIWIAALVWVGVNLTIYRNRKEPDRIQGLMRFDISLRSAVLVTVFVAGLASLVGAGVTDDASLAAKLLIYAAAIFLSLVLRFVFRPYRPALARIVAGTGSEEDTRIMKRSLARSKPVILGIWAMTVAAAAIGLWQPF